VWSKPGVAIPTAAPALEATTSDIVSNPTTVTTGIDVLDWRREDDKFARMGKKSVVHYERRH
jgi:hypothetical protein